MSKEKHGKLGRFIKVLMVIIFFAIGAALITLGAVCRAKGWDIGSDYNYKWLSILNIVFGSILLTSPFFLNHKRGGLNWVIKILMVIVFTIFGLTLIITNSIAIAKAWFPDYKWFPIVNLVFGCLLFTAPFFLKKD